MAYDRRKKTECREKREVRQKLLLLALNYSQEAVSLLAQKRIDLDLFKCPDWPDLVAQAQSCLPTHVHFGLNAGTGQIPNVDFKLVEDLLSRTTTRNVNIHISPDRAQFKGVSPNDTKPASIEAVADVLLQDIGRVVQRFGKDRVIIENMPWWGGLEVDYMRAAAETSVLTMLVNETGCGLLLDIAHARITSMHLRIPFRDYIAQLPVRSLREMHITGLSMVEGRMRDHFPLEEAAWDSFSWAIDQISQGRWARPWMVAFEYGGVRLLPPFAPEPSVLLEQVPRLMQMVHSA